MRTISCGVAALSALLACGGDDPVAPDPGALITVAMTSQVGVLLDEIPEPMRDRVAQRLLAKPNSYWIERARGQIKLSNYRLVFRQFFYEDKLQLPLPPEEVQAIALLDAPRRAMVGDHDYVLVDYRMTSVLVTTSDSPAEAEPALAAIGGTWTEPFQFPIDPELLFQRTRYACADEADFPPGSVDSEEMDTFYDYECEVETALSSTGCHQTELPTMSCLDALDARVGRIETGIKFERIAWSQALADQFRVGEVTNPDGADLELVEEEFRNHRVIYRYFPPTSCALVEGCVGGAGWRRLLQFSISDRNTGAEALDIGAVDYYLTGGNGYVDEWGLFEFSACHQHYHFSHFGDYHYGPEIEQKNGFCLQSTARVMNHEQGPLTNPYGSCEYQGIAAGWTDQYKAGLDCQWVDVTTVDTSAGEVTHPLSFTSNPDGFLCEGTPILDDNGDPTWEETDFDTADGDPVYRHACERFEDWDANNFHSYDATLPLDGGGYVTRPCDRGAIGPLRNCGFADSGDTFACSPGQTTTLHCGLRDQDGAPQIARVCDYSAALGVGTACTFQDAFDNTVITADGVDLTFTCPSAKDAAEPGGRVSLYSAPVYNDDPPAPVECTLAL